MPPQRTGGLKGMICAMNKSTPGPAAMMALLTVKQNQRGKDALSMLPLHSKGSIRIKADETKTG